MVAIAFKGCIILFESQHLWLTASHPKSLKSAHVIAHIMWRAQGSTWIEELSILKEICILPSSIQSIYIIYMNIIHICFRFHKNFSYIVFSVGGGSYLSHNIPQISNIFKHTKTAAAVVLVKVWCHTLLLEAPIVNSRLYELHDLSSLVGKMADGFSVKSPYPGKVKRLPGGKDKNVNP